MAEKKYTRVTAGGNLRFIRPAQLAEEGTTGQILEGIYIGPVQNQLDPEKYDFKFETENETVIVNSAGSLAAKMKKVAKGSVVRLSYHGKEKIQAGRMKGKDAHNFEVDLVTEA